MMSPMNNTLLIDSLEARRLFAVDLAVSSVQVTAYDASTGTLTVQTDISNFGSTDTPSTGAGAFVVSKDQVINNADDVRIDTISPTETPRISQKTLTRTMHISGNVPAGDYYVGVALDIDNQVPELTEANNFQFTNTTIHVPSSFALSFDGTAGPDKITVTKNGTTSLDITINGTKNTYPISRIGSLAIYGLDGNDIISADPTITLPMYLNGGDGNDAIGGGAGNDVLTGGAGKDTLRGAGGHDRINGNGGNDQLYGETGPDFIYGGAGGDYMDGGSSGDHFDGGAGADTMYGQGGADVFATGGDGTVDYLFGGSGKDTSTADTSDIRASVLLSA
jgi:Ca2+-binding RTX toxin-like protein